MMASLPFALHSRRTSNVLHFTEAAGASTSPENRAGQPLAILRKSPRPPIGVSTEKDEDLASLNTLEDQNSRIELRVENQ